ncbi:MarR family winged helix-turn-helix transcriptional regulator [Paracoccus sp. Ld10]|uniref:MarR family winged helix-turn-helix transcriptional regulator n=1 Tax=Paracoccus sp. Ld10 TaxID=649158 RepID=UPI0038659E4D
MSDDPALPNPSPFHDMLCFDVYAVNLAFGRIYKPLLDPLGLTYPQFLVMMVLWASDHHSVGGIGDSLGLDSSTLTPLLKRLEAANLVTRKRDMRDERRVIVSLTPQGAALHGQSERVRTCVAGNTGLNQETAQALREQLRRLRHRLQQPSQD